MDPATITVKVKEIVANVTGISADNISDSATFVDDLGLDSLAILEIVVDVEKAFKVRASEEELQKIRSIQDSVGLVLQHTCLEAA
jgi:acyl carrier protein